MLIKYYESELNLWRKKENSASRFSVGVSCASSLIALVLSLSISPPQATNGPGLACILLRVLEKLGEQYYRHGCPDESIVPTANLFKSICQMNL